MGLIFCRECGKQISERAVDCLHCGHPMNREEKIDEVDYEIGPIYENPREPSETPAQLKARTERLQKEKRFLRGKMGVLVQKVDALTQQNKRRSFWVTFAGIILVSAGVQILSAETTKWPGYLMLAVACGLTYVAYLDSIARS